MNFLAHLLLSGDQPDWIAGGFLGDFVKGQLKGQYPTGIEAGIQLHRRIDVFTDRHPCMKSCQTLFNPEMRRYSGIIVDISFDHFLARHWQRYHHSTLIEFNELILRTLQQSSELFPDSARIFLNRMSTHNILLRYQLSEAIPTVLATTGQRLTRSNPLRCSGEQFLEHYDALESIFFDFFPALQAFALEHQQQTGTRLFRKKFNRALDSD